MRRPNLRDQRGTAVTETMLLTWIVILFIAAALQLFRTNQAIYSSVVSAHMQMFEGAWQHNCFDKKSKCVYNSDLHAQVRWHPTNMPEVLVPKVGLFSSYLPGELRLRAWPDAATKRNDGYKRTRMGAGTYYPICQCAGLLGDSCMKSLHSVPGMGFC